MDRYELQKKIDQQGKRAKDMREIGESYLRGDVLKDEVAAEGWLMKAIETGDPVEAAVAMELIALEIVGANQVISREDYLEIKREYEYAKGEKRAELEVLLNIAARTQKKR